MLKREVVLHRGIYVYRKFRAFRQSRHCLCPNPIGLYPPEARFHLGDERAGECGGGVIAMSGSEAGSYQH